MEASPPAGGETPAGPTSEIPYPTSGRAWWTAVVFFILYNLSFIDRQMINLLVEPIKATLDISDFQISLLQGFTFAVFYCFLGLPIGWLVDNRPRRAIVAAGVIVWSLATAGCGLASRFWHMAVARIGVATGEATLAPAAYSILGDTFPPHKLAMPMSLMGAGAPLGTALAAVFAGLITTIIPSGVYFAGLGHFEPWQIAFISVALPGMLLAPLVFTVREPVRRVLPNVSLPGKRAALAHIITHKRLYFGHFFGFAAFSMCNYAIASWIPTFYIRAHDFSLAQAALAFGTINLVAGFFGAVTMGFTVDRWFGSGRHDAHLRFFAMAAVTQMVLLVITTQVADWQLSILFLIPVLTLVSFTGVAAAALTIVTPTQLRGQVSAIYLLIFNLLGLGVGPSIVAIFTDFVFADEARVGDSLALTLAIFAPISAALLLFAAPAMRLVVEAQQTGSA